PMMARMDLVVEVPPVTAADLALPAPAEGTVQAAARVARARQIQLERAAEDGESAAPLNAQASGARLEAIAALDAPARALLSRAAEAAGLTARGWTRTLRLARTIADLDGAPQVRRTHLAEALIYRRVSSAPGVLAG
ncbi:MAG TPA: ATP-binding protein, partial [Phenylobacterium sp.]|nr:ATP-binding protein [Phenylobacterium sp.]